MTTLDGALYLAESEPPFISKMWEAIQTAEPLEGAPSSWPMRRIITTLYEGLLHLKALGRTPAQICEFLTEYSGLGITPSTLATYLSREKRQRQGGERPSSSSRNPSAVAVMAVAAIASSTPEKASIVEEIQEPVELRPVESAAIQPVQMQPVDVTQTQAYQTDARSERSPSPKPSINLIPPLPSTATAVTPDPKPMTVAQSKQPSSGNQTGSLIQPTTARPVSDFIESATSLPLPETNRPELPRRKPKPWRSDEPDNPPAPEALLDEPTFNTIERN